MHASKETGSLVISCGRGVTGKETPTSQTQKIGNEAADYVLSLIRDGKSVILCASGKFSKSASEVEAGSGERWLREADHMALIAAKKGIPYFVIRRDPDSTNTYENMLNAARIVNGEGFIPSEVVVVSAKEQNKRASYIARKIFGKRIVSVPVASETTNNLAVKIIEGINTILSRIAFEGVRDGDIESARIQIRKQDVLDRVLKRNSAAKVAMGGAGGAYLPQSPIK
ncbi:MAG: YdcF family protein [Candidatus Marsarchaeota archaeon]|nr:YdcF family protein [Candidatus Marsarchaeota archaeon]